MLSDMTLASSPTLDYRESVDSDSGTLRSEHSGGGQSTLSDSSTDTNRCIVLRVECLGSRVLKVG